MASKGQKFNKYNLNLKDEVLKQYLNGISSTNLSKEYNIPKGTIKTWSMKVLHPEKYPGQGQKRGRPKELNLTKEDWEERYKILKKYQAFLKAQRERK